MFDFLKQLLHWTNAQSSGLEKLSRDTRDLSFFNLIEGTYGTYTPLGDAKSLSIITIKNQRGHQNCSFQAWSSVAQLFFKDEISARYSTAKAWQQGLCNPGGAADLRSGAKVLQKFGCVLEKDCPSDETLSWEDYVNIDFTKYDTLASQRKIGSYYRLYSTDDILKAIDNGHGVVVGRMWKTSMNTGGGFSYPYILPRTGFDVGGHATAVVGDNLYYQGRKVSSEISSYGLSYGQSGHLFCPLEDLQGDMNIYGAYAISDIAYQKKTV